jgi:hypothetical protein
MHRIPPGQKMRKRTEELLNQGLDGEADVTDLIVRLPLDEWFRRWWNRKWRIVWSAITISAAVQSRSTVAIAMATSRGAFEPLKRKSSCRCLQCETRLRPDLPG